MAKKRKKKKKLPGMKRVSIYKSDFLNWSTEHLWFFFLTHPALYRAYSRQQKISFERAVSTVRYVLLKYDKEILARDFKVVYQGYKQEVPLDVNWNKKIYREFVVLINMYIKELKTGEELFPPPALVSIDCSDRWLFSSYKYSDLEEEVVENFRLRYLIYQLFTGQRSLGDHPIDINNPLEGLLELID